ESYLRGRQQTFNLSDHAVHFFLISQCNHEKLVALVKADDAVGEQPDSVKKWIAAQNPTDWRASDAYGVDYLCEHRRARGATEGAEQRRADILCHLALKFDAFTLSFIQFTGRNSLLLFFQVLLEFLACFFQSPDRQRRMSQPVRMCAQQHQIQSRKRCAGTNAEDERSRNHGGFAWILFDPIFGF